MRTFGALHTIDSEIDKAPAAKRRKSKAAQRPRSARETMSMKQPIQFDLSQIQRCIGRRQVVDDAPSKKTGKYKARKDRLALPESE